MVKIMFLTKRFFVVSAISVHLFAINRIVLVRLKGALMLDEQAELEFRLVCC